MSVNHRKVLINASQIEYYPLLIWMSYSRTLNNRTNKLKEPALSWINKNYKLAFSDLLKQADFLLIVDINYS